MHFFWYIPNRMAKISRKYEARKANCTQRINKTKRTESNGGAGSGRKCWEKFFVRVAVKSNLTKTYYIIRVRFGCSSEKTFQSVVEDGTFILFVERVWFRYVCLVLGVESFFFCFVLDILLLILKNVAACLLILLECIEHCRSCAAFCLKTILS